MIKIKSRKIFLLEREREWETKSRAQSQQLDEEFIQNI